MFSVLSAEMLELTHKNIVGKPFSVSLDGGNGVIFEVRLPIYYCDACDERLDVFVEISSQWRKYLADPVDRGRMLTRQDGVYFREKLEDIIHSRDPWICIDCCEE